MQSPLDLEKKIITVENSLVQSWVKLPTAYPVLMMAGVFLIYHYIIIPLASVYAPFNLRIHLFTERNDFYTICGIGALISYFSSQLRHLLLFILPFIAWLGAFFIRGVPFSLSMLAFPLLALLFFGLSKVLSKNIWQRIFRAFVAVLLFISAAYWMLLESSQGAGITIVSKFWLTHPEFYLLFVVIFLMKGNESRSTGALLFPLNLAWGTLWPSDSEYKVNLETLKFKKLWWSGFYALSVSIIFYILAFGLRYLLKDEKLGILSTVGFYYIFFIFMIVGSFNVHVGLSRMLGMQCPDATYFLLLAKTPLEVWQRGSTYVYKFFLNYIYIPLQRKIRSYIIVMILCLFVVVMHLFIFHEVIIRLFFMWLLPDLAAPNVQVFNIFVFSSVWALLWFFWILIGATVWRKLLNLFPGAKVQWVSILVNHLVIASIFPMAENWLTPMILKALS